MIAKAYLYSYGLKSISIVIKFVLITLLVKELTLEEYGRYSYFVIVSGLFLFVLGGDFYNYTHSNIAGIKSKIKKRYYISQHLFFISCSVLVLTIMFLVYIVYGGSDYQILGLFFFITLTEYLTTEYYRYLVIFGLFNQSNILLFLKSTGWVVAILLFHFLGYQLSVKLILLTWAVASVLIFIILLYLTLKSQVKFFYFSIFSIKSIYKGLLFSAPFFLASILYKLNEYFDRFFVENYLGSAELGVYSVFYSFIGVVQTFIFVGVLAKIYPKILASHNTDDLLIQLKNLFVVTFLTVLFLSVFIFSMFDFYANLVGRPELVEYKSVFLVLLVGNMFFCLSFSFHYVLVRAKESMKILYSSIGAMCVNILCLFFLIPAENLFYISLCFLMSMVSLFAIKLYFSKNAIQRAMQHEKN